MLSAKTSQSRAISGNTAIARFDVYQNNIRPDSADAVPGDHIVVLPTHHAKDLTGTGNDDGGHTPVRNFHLQITNKPQPLSVVDADDLFAA